jgi:hypothetical protein
VSTEYRCHHFCHLEMSLLLGSGGGWARSLCEAQRPSADRARPVSALGW